MLCVGEDCLDQCQKKDPCSGVVKHPALAQSLSNLDGSKRLRDPKLPKQQGGAQDFFHLVQEHPSNQVSDGRWGSICLRNTQLGINQHHLSDVNLKGLSSWPKLTCQSWGRVTHFFFIFFDMRETVLL